MSRRRSPLPVGLAAVLVVLMARPAFAADPTSDPESGAQWGLVAVKAPEAWARGKGAGTSVAIVSTGIAKHEDLVAKVDVGFDAVGTDPTNDSIGRGTHLAGIVGAETANGIGIAGVAPDTRLLPFRAFNTTSTRGDGHIAALNQARTARPVVVLVDLPDSYTGDKELLRQALRAVGDAGISVVIGAHAGLLVDDLPVLAVAATTQAGALVPGTGAVGPRGVAAPGDAIRSTTVVQPALPLGKPTFGYGDMSGSGQAAAHVAGALAILRGLGADATMAADLLRSTARKTNSATLGAGAIDIAAAAAAYQTAPPATTPTTKKAGSTPVSIPKSKATTATTVSPVSGSGLPGQPGQLSPPLPTETTEPGAGEAQVVPPGVDELADSGETAGATTRTIPGRERPWGSLAVGFGVLFGVGSSLSLTFRRLADAAV